MSEVKTTGDWVKDLYDAAEELGWRVVRVDMYGVVTLESRKGYITLEIRGVPLTGAMLRRMLQAHPDGV